MDSKVSVSLVFIIITVPDTGKSKSFLSSIPIVVTYDQIAVVRIRHIIQRLLEYRINTGSSTSSEKIRRCLLARKHLHRCCPFDSLFGGAQDVSISPL